MPGDVRPLPSSVPWPAWPLVALRLVLIGLLLALCVPLHLLWRLLGLRRLWSRIFLSGTSLLAGIRVRRRGRRVPGALLLANHVSWMDIPVLSYAANSAFVAHDGLAQFRFLKWLCEMNDTVFIARHRRADVSRQAEDIRAAMGGGQTLTLFPEGTTSDGTWTLPFKSSLLGALEPLPGGVSVQPVTLLYRNPLAVSWTGHDPGLANFLRILARPQGVRVSVIFGAPLADAALANRKSMSAAAQQAVRGAMDDRAD